MPLKVPLLLIAAVVTFVVITRATSSGEVDVSEPIVNIDGLGSVAGIVEYSTWSRAEFHSFYGIPFAEPPSGDRRYLAPVARRPWTGVLNATQQARICPQSLNQEEIGNGEVQGDPEDCLTLNVFTRKISKESRKLLPVMVLIHGGGYYEGSAQKFPPHYLMEQEIVLVVIQYRIGPLGFLSMQIDSIPGNAGLLDQVLALQWVQEHISNFGGDNTRVTVAGQSAGAVSISLLLLSPLVNENHFQRAIMQSGSAFADWVYDDNPILYAKELASAIFNDTKKSLSDTTVEDILKNATVYEILLAYNKVKGSSLKRAVIGGMNAISQQAGSVKFMVQSPNDAAEDGKLRTLPMISGATKNDGSFIAASIYDALESYGVQDNDEFIRSNIAETVISTSNIIDTTGAIKDIFEDTYFDYAFKQENVTFGIIAPGLIDMAGVLFIKAPVVKQLRLNSRSDRQTYAYSFDYIGEHTRFGYGEDTSKYPFSGGVHHSDDLMYLFPWPYETPLNEKDTEVAKNMVDLWTTFVITGEFNTSLWPQFNPASDGPYLHINRALYVGSNFKDDQYTVSIREYLNQTILR